VSHILRPGNTAFKGQLKLVNGFERHYQRIHALKKKKKKKKDRGRELLGFKRKLDNRLANVLDQPIVGGLYRALPTNSIIKQVK
jgi:hypothetical protein